MRWRLGDKLLLISRGVKASQSLPKKNRRSDHSERGRPIVYSWEIRAIGFLAVRYLNKKVYTAIVYQLAGWAGAKRMICCARKVDANSTIR